MDGLVYPMYPDNHLILSLQPTLLFLITTCADITTNNIFQQPSVSFDTSLTSLASTERLEALHLRQIPPF